MKTLKISIFVFALILPFFALSQVGIGTITPNAQLEIKSTNQATPSNTDGILIPKIDEFPSTSPTASQDGMMVYVTGSGTPSKGYYYWDNVAATWKVFSSSVGKINDLTDGKSDEDGTNNGSSIFLGINAGANDDSTDNRNLGIGNNALSSNTNADNNVAIGFQSLLSHTSGGYNTAVGNHSLKDNTDGYQNTAQGGFSLSNNISGILNTAIGYSALVTNTNGGANTAIGHSSLFKNTLGNNNTSVGRQSLYNNLTGNYNTALGLNSGYNNTGNKNVFLGVRAGYNETGSNKLYIEDTDADASNALIYGEFGSDNTTTGNILRINGELQLGNSLANRYAMPTGDGTINQVMQTDGSGGLSWVDASTLSTDKNTLDGAYDEGGAGAGRTITATDGAVTIAGEDGLLVKGTLGSGDVVPAGAGTKMYFNPRKAAFRAGYATGSQWDDTNVGNYSIAFGYGNIASGDGSTALGGGATVASGGSSIATGESTTASGDASTAMGYTTIASGKRSTAMGTFTIAHSFAETTIGIFNTPYTPNSTSSWNATDRLFVIGNGADASNKSNALTIYKNGLLNINDEYNMPLTDGTTNQVMQTDGSENVTWVDATSVGTDDQNISGSGLSGTTLTIGIEGGTNETVDLSSLQDGTGAQTINQLNDAKYNSTSLSLYLGEDAGASDTGNGDRNLGIGYQSLFNNSTGDGNTSIGYQTMYNASGIGNTAIGQQALSQGNIGNGNTAIGLWASRANNSGSSNLTMGAQSYYANTTGSGNTILGTTSGRYVNGDNNTMIGYQSGHGNGTVSNFSRSVFIGYNSGYYETNSDRLYIENSSTSSPLIYGEFDNNLIRINGTLDINNQFTFPSIDGATNQVIQTDGSGNLSWVDPSSLDDGDWTTVGADIERQSGDVYIGNTANTNNNLYISASLIDWDTPSYYLNPGNLNIMNEIQFDTGSASDPKIRFTETNSGFYSPGTDITSYTANGTEAVRFEANGMVKILTAIDAGGTAGTGSLEIGGSLRLDNNEIITNTNTTLYIQHNNTGDLWIDNGTFMVDASTNRLGILNTAPSTDVHLKQSDNLQAGGGGVTFESALAAINWKIYHSGSAISFAENGVRRAYISASTGAYIQTSDRTLKKSISLVEDNVLSKLSEINVYRYHYLDQSTSEEKTMGVMAQDIQPYFPELVSTGEDGNLGMNYAGLSVVAIQAIKEQQKEIENQRKEIDELKKLVQQLIDKK